MNQIKLGKFIAKVRTERGITQDELAEKIGVSSGKVISKWECGNNMPDFETLIEISKALKITLYELQICKRIENPKLIEKAKTKFRTFSDYIKNQIKNKIIVVLGIILGIIFGFSTIFTIDNYKTIKIYKMVNNQLENKYRISGNIFVTPDYTIVNLIKINNIEDDTKYLDINASKLYYEILDSQFHRVLLFDNIKSENKGTSYNLLQALNSASFTTRISNDDLPKDPNLKLKITYNDNYNTSKEILIDFTIEQIFENTL